jgi:hypothetical protein
MDRNRTGPASCSKLIVVGNNSLQPSRRNLEQTDRFCSSRRQSPCHSSSDPISEEQGSGFSSYAIRRGFPRTADEVIDRAKTILFLHQIPDLSMEQNGESNDRNSNVKILDVRHETDGLGEMAVPTDSRAARRSADAASGTWQLVSSVTGFEDGESLRVHWPPNAQ